MRAKSMVLIFIALVCGLVASIGISQVMDSGTDENAAQIETEEVYVALADIDIDEPLSAENVRLEQWPAGRVPENTARTLEEIEGLYPRNRFVQGEPILVTRLRTSRDSPGDTIPAGYRVVPIEVRKDTISQFINPGDRVDIIGFFRRSPEVPQTMTRKILRNVRLFAVNSTTDRAVDEDGNAVNVQTISLLVKNEQVNKLLLAVELGTLRMSLRRPDENPDDDLAEDADVASIFQDQDSNADEDDPTASEGSDDGDDLLAMLGNDMSVGSPLDISVGTPLDMPIVEEPPKFAMVITGPDGSPRKWIWRDEEGPAEEVFDDVYGAAPALSAPVTEKQQDSSDDGDDEDESTEELDESEEQDEEVDEDVRPKSKKGRSRTEI